MIKSYKTIKSGKRFHLVNAPRDATYEVVCLANNCGGIDIPYNHCRVSKIWSNNVVVYKVTDDSSEYFEGFFCRSTEFFCNTATIIRAKRKK